MSLTIGPHKHTSEQAVDSESALGTSVTMSAVAQFNRAGDTVSVEVIQGTHANRGGRSVCQGVKKIKQLLLLAISALSVGAVFLSLLQGRDWSGVLDESRVSDVVETSFAVESKENDINSREPFEGVKVGRVWRVPYRHPILYTERMTNPVFYSPKWYKKDLFGMSLVPIKVMPSDRAERSVEHRADRVK